jgi:hypothetical protein
MLGLLILCCTSLDPRLPEGIAGLKQTGHWYSSGIALAIRTKDDFQLFPERPSPYIIERYTTTNQALRVVQVISKAEGHPIDLHSDRSFVRYYPLSWIWPNSHHFLSVSVVGAVANRYPTTMFLVRSASQTEIVAAQKRHISYKPPVYVSEKG